MAAELKCTVVVLKIADGEEGKIAEVLVRRTVIIFHPEFLFQWLKFSFYFSRYKATRTEAFIDIRVCVIGTVGCGKSTVCNISRFEARFIQLVGVLINGDLDDGKGLARMDMLCHRHEVKFLPRFFVLS